MIKKYTDHLLLMSLALGLWSCEPNVDTFVPSHGSADFTKFIAIGDSYTAGYTDGALGRRGQEESFSYILGKQLMYAGSESFNQPLVKSEASVGTTVLAENQNNGYFELKVVDGAFKPVPVLGDMGIFTESVYSANNQNFGVPGAKVTHLALEAPYPPYSTLNPFFKRFASTPEATVMGDALAAHPTFVSLWIGNNDVLGYALAGGEDDEITDVALFAGLIDQYAGAIAAGGAKAVMGNIPAIESIPYFNTVAYNVLPLDADKAAQLNAGYTKYNEGVDLYNSQVPENMQLPYISFQEGANALIIEDEDYPINGMRQIKTDEKLVLTLPSDKIANEGWGTMVPVPAEYVLDEEELEDIDVATKAYNTAIKATCEKYGFAMVDLNKKMEELSTTGLIIDGHRYTSQFVTGGVFSLDGIHATGRGSAIIANAFIDAINAKFNASVPRANINDYNTVEFP
ncbi:MULTISPECIES: SGNH/GDSL hydrolase family protein [unclassified Carboxylicivirga]|uniref:SGNH/GDSL hydrolase family protein n=1 Tax=Carboxylicivirga TaxID=1628153 RepID=UPI003D34B284